MLWEEPFPLLHELVDVHVKELKHEMKDVFFQDDLIELNYVWMM